MEEDGSQPLIAAEYYNFVFHLMIMQYKKELITQFDKI